MVLRAGSLSGIVIILLLLETSPWVQNENLEIKLENATEELNDLLADLEETLRLGKFNSQAVEDHASLSLFKSRVSCMKSCFDRFLAIYSDAKLWAKRLSEDCTSINETKAKARNIYYEILSISENVLNPTDPNTSAMHNETKPSIKLPTIPLPQFNGDLTTWTSFKDTFLSLVHTNPDLDPIRRFHYLRSSLKGPALQTITKIPFTASDYNQAWEALIKRYDNKRILATHYLMNIFNFKPITKHSTANLEQFCETVLENAEAFRNLRLDDPSGFLLYTFALRLLDPKTKSRFENEYGQSETIPGFAEFSTFMQRECLKLQTNALTASPPTATTSGDSNPRHTKHVFLSVGDSDNPRQCPICQNNHLIYECSTFQNLTPRERYSKIRDLNRCLNCFCSGHYYTKCPSGKKCRFCSRSHHSLLHSDDNRILENTSTTLADNQKVGKKTVTSPLDGENPAGKTRSEPIFSSSASGETNVLLGTARVRIRDAYGNFQLVRLLVDSGSQRSFISYTCAQRLALNPRKSTQRLVGLGNLQIPGGNAVVECVLVPRNMEAPRLRTTAIVLDQISGDMPVRKLDKSIKETLSGLDLADPEFDEPGPIEFLLGADLFGSILTGGSVKVPGSNTHALQTIFGRLLIGEVSASPTDQLQSFLIMEEGPGKNPDLAVVMSRFWEVEEVPFVSQTDPEDAWCEDYFSKTHTRDQDGRYIVKLPLRSNPPSPLSSKEGALRRFHSLEHKFSKTSVLKGDYNQVMENYIKQNYMAEAERPGKYFLPHHGVLKDSTSTKLRVVFDASHRSFNGSLNDHLVTGPKLQNNIRDVLINFRIHKYAMVTDICQMYLQIIVDETDRPFQHLYYRFEPDQALREFEFNRLTFGMSCSLYLALRVIRQLLKDEGNEYPNARVALSKNIYMDDILTGADNLTDAAKLQRELIDLLSRGGFTPKKWSSNSERLLEDLPPDSRVTLVPLDNFEDTTVKLLGLQWEPKRDCLSYRIDKQKCTPTKRGILSTIARMYDPVGYLSPVIFKAKCLMQRLWETKIDWDEAIPDTIEKDWIQFFDDLGNLSKIAIPRCMFPGPSKDIKLIGFADASSLGYAAVMYLRFETYEGQISSQLLTAKTRLAPLKPLSIPRLELCAALLLVNTIESLRPILENIGVNSMTLISDSSTVLTWLKLPYSRLKVFVANRVAKILDTTSINSWYHVASEQNGADVASRGTDPSSLPPMSTWWAGPAWLIQPINDWPLKPAAMYTSGEDEIPETKVVSYISRNDLETDIEEIMQRFSSYQKMLRVLSYAFRFLKNIKILKNRKDRVVGRPTLSEIKVTERKLIKVTQRQYFETDLQCLSQSKKLKSLAPFEDSNGLIRVGGRLKNAPIDYEWKHPIILPAKSRLATLVIDHLHLMHLHAGPQLVQSLLKRRYWIPSGRNLIRSRIHKCLKCHRLRTAGIQPIMGDLPSSRFEQGRPFLNVGLDFAGPFMIRESMRRKAALGKAYVCVFICMATKAVHVEVVSSLSTDAFLAALDRFIGRRGIPSRLYSDNGKTFVGANNRLRELYQWWNNKDTKETIDRHLTLKEIQWSFIPPSAPHFGGLWEAGVKSFKYHFTRIMESQPWTYEELSTVSARIEAVLNSRPLCPQSSSIDNFEVLTPGHFILGEAPTCPPATDWSDTPSNRLSRWQFLQKCMGDFWKKWKLDYLSTLQQRVKWTKPTPNINPGTMVLLRDDHTAPLLWSIGRVMDIYPGTDNTVRVAKVKTPKGEYVRAVTRLAPLFPEGL